MFRCKKESRAKVVFNCTNGMYIYAFHSFAVPHFVSQQPFFLPIAFSFFFSPHENTSTADHTELPRGYDRTPLRLTLNSVGFFDETAVDLREYFAIYTTYTIINATLVMEWPIVLDYETDEKKWK